jgi:nicotinate-nucleotide pyrophosphorylase (carboxylating)
LLEKYAVKMGGGRNHRIGLFDGILLKENHIALAGGVKAALDQGHSFASSRMKPRAMTAYDSAGAAPSGAEASSIPIQIAVRNESELQEALSAGAEAVLLDHMSPAASGANYISSGALTHSAPNADMTLLVDSLQ